MQKKIALFLLSLSGWRVNPERPDCAQRCVMIASPHTSNWDLWYARLAFYVLGIPMRFTIKKAWMTFPFNLLIGPLGGIGIDRKPRKKGDQRRSYVESMVELLEKHDRIAVVVTPEGTRSLRTKWKSGFYRVAQQAGVPICFGYVNYREKEAGVGGYLIPGDDEAADMKKVMAFYRNIPPKYPEKFSVDERYA